MGCRTGFYLILVGDYKSADIIPLLAEMFDWVEKFTGAIPGASPEECGNWREQNIEMAKWECARYAKLLKNASKENLEYPSSNV
jgi:S-ribosylhomocysteine lyase